MDVKNITKEAVTVNEEASFREALEAMVHGKTNTLLVVNSNGILTGEVSVTDLLDAIVPEYLNGDNIAAHFATEEMFEEAVKSTEETQVQFFMSSDFSTVTTNDSLMTVAATAIGHQRMRIPVVDTDGRPVGIISRQGIKHIIAKFLNIEDIA